MEHLRWIAAAALSAYACHLAVHHTTPIDAALPLMAVGLTVLAWITYPALMLGVPMLILAEIALPDETMRLLAFGTVWSAATLVAALTKRTQTAPIIAVILIVLLRWLPTPYIGRELLLLAIAVALVFILGRTPFAIAIAVLTALITPAVPLRTFVVPLIILIVAATARIFGMPDLKLAWPSALVLAFVMLFFAWSGIVARAFPYFLRATHNARRMTITQALTPNQSMTYEVPHGATTIVLSGANVARLKRGALLGYLDPGHQEIRIGDAADWGYMRREQFYRAHNPLPRDAAGRIRGYGYTAWVDGAGRVPLPRGARTIRVTADASLPAGAQLQVEGFE